MVKNGYYANENFSLALDRIEVCQISLFITTFHVLTWNKNCLFFFLSGFSFTDTGDSQDRRKREGTIFYSTLRLPPAHKHSDIYLQLCMWDDSHIFRIWPLEFTRLLLDEIYHLIELPVDWLIMWFLFLFVYLINWF